MRLFPRVACCSSLNNAWAKGAFASALVLASAAGLCRAAEADGGVLLKADPSRIIAIPASPDPGSLLEGVARRAGGEVRVIVRCAGPLRDVDADQLRAAGVALLAPLGNFSFFATLDAASLDARAINASGLVRGALPVERAWKIDPRLVRTDAALLWGPASAPAAVGDQIDPLLPVTIQLFADVKADNAARAIVEKHAESTHGSLTTIPVFLAHVRASKLAALADENIVQWIEPAAPAMGELNAENRVLVQANQAQASPYNLNGAGVSVLVYDSGNVLRTHNDLTPRVTIVDTGDTVATHSTHVAGTVGGSGAASAGNNRGMAPGVTILSAGLGPLTSGWLYSNPVDIEVDYASAYDAGADLATNSISTNVSNNNFECAWEGDYPVTSQLIDTIVRGDSAAVTDNTPFRITWAAGNERSSTRCSALGFNSVPPPSGAKNQICVGSVDSNTDLVSSFSTWGPTDDGRMKPDLAAPGCQTTGDLGVTSTSDASNTAYTSLCGTSMATPTVAGCVALMLQDFRAQFPQQPDPRNSTVKALLAHSAVDQGTPGPDYKYGYGSVRVLAAIDLMRSGRFVERVAPAGDFQLYTVTVPAGAPDLTITIAWDDPAGTPNAAVVLVNNLDLAVFDPAGLQRHVWTLTPGTPAAGAVQTAPNTRDNIEQVKVLNPPAGTYSVRVDAGGVQSGSQIYSLVSSHPFTFTGGQPHVFVNAVQLAPALVNPAQTSPLTVRVLAFSDTIVPGSAHLFYRGSPTAPYASVPLTNASGDLYTATLPGFPCDALPQYYFEVMGTASGTVRLPLGAPTTALLVGLDAFQVTLTDDAETDTGWTLFTTGDNATTGRWQRADPEQTSAQPGDDHTAAPGTMCFVTDARAGLNAGDFDVDNGKTTLTSPVFDMSSNPQVKVSYWRWYSQFAGNVEDTFVAQISGDNGVTWLPLETLGPCGPLSPPCGPEVRGGWNKVTFTVSNFVTPTSQVKLRFIVNDIGEQNIVEAVIDDLSIQTFVCVPQGCDSIDFNRDGVFPDSLDVSDYLSVFGGGACSNDPPTGPGCGDLDFNNDGVSPDSGDIESLLQIFGGGVC